MIIQAILVGLIAAWGSLDYTFGILYISRPIVLGPLVGLALEDVEAGVEIGASLELLFTGTISVGIYMPPDVNVGRVLTTAFAISTGKEVDAAVALTMPIAVVSLGIGDLVSVITPVCLKTADDGAAQGNDSKIMFTQWLMGAFATSYKSLLTFGVFYTGAGEAQDLLDLIPQLILDGIGAAVGILPAIDFAMLMRMIIDKKLIPFFLLGSVLASYADIPVLGMAIIAVIIAVEKFGFLGGKPRPAGNAEEVDNDGDF